jgi:hypothetical protein
MLYNQLSFPALPVEPPSIPSGPSATLSVSSFFLAASSANASKRSFFLAALSANSNGLSFILAALSARQFFFETSLADPSATLSDCHLLRADPSSTFSEHPFSLPPRRQQTFCPRSPLPTRRQVNFRRHFPLPTLRHAASSVNLSEKLANNPQFQPHSIQFFTKSPPFESIFSTFYTKQ